MITRRALLAASAGLLARPAGAAESVPGLRAVAKGIVYGSATANYELKDADFRSLLPREAAILVPEYELKRNLVEPEQGRYDFSAGDALLAFARQHALLFRGHPLVWYGSNPPWLEDKVIATRDPSLLTGYVRAVAGHYRGQVHSWDVVNEAIMPGEGRSDGMRDNFWLKAFGPAYVDLAFHAARAADPAALLVYNDWVCDGADKVAETARALTLKFLDGLIGRGVPVDAFGLQGHMSAFGPALDQGRLRDFLAEIKARGLAILVTEHDVDDSGGPSDFAARDTAVADASERFLDVVLDNRAVKTVLTWGLSDRYLDPPQDWKLRLRGWKGRMLPFDSSLARKPMAQAMARAFAGRPS